MRRDKHSLIQALKDMDASMVQAKMALILFYINGIESAMAFVEHIKSLSHE